MARQLEAAVVPQRVEVWTYARYSSDRQNERSIADQERLCAETCKRLGLPLPSRAFRDAALSGASMGKRAGLQDLLNAAAQPPSRGVRRVLAIESLDRQGRNIYDSFDIIRRLHREGGMRIVTSDGRDSDAPSFKAMLLADSFVADVFLDNLRTHTKRGLDARVAEGFHVGRISFGYRVENRRLVINEPQARVIRRMFELTASGVSTYRIAGCLTAEGMPCSWTQAQVSTRLHRILYRGDVWRDGRIARHEERLRIVPEELWVAVQAAVHARNSAASRPGSNLVSGSPPYRKHLLSGLIGCACCGEPVSVRARRRGHWWYGCPAGTRHPTCENRGQVAGAPLEKAMIDAVLATVLDADAVEHVVAEVRRRVATADGERVVERQQIARDLARVQREIDRLVRYVAEHEDATAVEGAIPERQERRRALQDRLAVLDRESPRVEVLRSAVEGYLERTAEMLRDGDQDRVRFALQRVVGGATLLREGQGWRLSFRVSPLGVLRECLIPGRSPTTMWPPRWSASAPASARSSLAGRRWGPTGTVRARARCSSPAWTATGWR